MRKTHSKQAENVFQVNSGVLPDENRDYYAVTISTNGNCLQWSVYSEWVGFKSVKPIIEIRKASFIQPMLVIGNWEKAKELYWVVNDLAHLCSYLNFGGHAVIEHVLAEEHLEEIIRPSECVSDAGIGFVDVKRDGKEISNKAPSRKLRMKILKRDQFKCRICGRRAKDYVDVELHVHHIRPWSKGGPTHERNLITLCQACHGGLDPHYEFKLYGLLGPGQETEYEVAVERYRQWIMSLP